MQSLSSSVEECRPNSPTRHPRFPIARPAHAQATHHNGQLQTAVSAAPTVASVSLPCRSSQSPSNSTVLNPSPPTSATPSSILSTPARPSLALTCWPSLYLTVDRIPQAIISIASYPSPPSHLKHPAPVPPHLSIPRPRRQCRFLRMPSHASEKPHGSATVVTLGWKKGEMKMVMASRSEQVAIPCRKHHASMLSFPPT